MRYIRIIAVFTALAALVAWPFIARAQDATAVRYQTITQECPVLLNLIDQIQRRDLVSRTNVGREYENVSKQLNAFTQRLRNNDLDFRPFEQLTAQFTAATNQFREAYVRYDDSINKLLTIDCQTKPADFDAQLKQSRTLRDATYTAANRANGIIGQYRTAVQQLPVAAQPQGGQQ